MAIFNNVFASQYTTSVTNSTVLNIQSHISNLRLSLLNFKDDDILRLIRFLKIHKAHGHDEISIHIIKVCDSAIVKSLLLIFKNCLNGNTFLDIWKKSNIWPIHKKWETNNYQLQTCLTSTLVLKNIWNSFWMAFEIIWTKISLRK